jgi:hypothetical protein
MPELVRLSLWGLITRLALPLVLSCNPFEREEQSPGSESHAPGGPDRPHLETIVSPDVVAVGDAVAITLTVEDDSVSLTVGPENESLARVEPGTILVSGAGNGFIRRVTAVTVSKAAIGESVTLATELASLVDVFIQSDFYHCQDLTLGPYSISERDLLGGGVTASVSAGYDVTFEFSPNLCVGWMIRDRRVEEFELTLLGAASTRALSTIELRAGADFQASPVLLRAPPLRVPLPTPIPLPMIIKPRLEARLSGGAEATVSLSNGLNFFSDGLTDIRYDAERWSITDDREVNVEAIAPDLMATAGGHLTVGLAPIVDFHLLGIAGPTLELEATVTAKVSVCAEEVPPQRWSIEGNARGRASGTFELFGLRGGVGPFDLISWGPRDLGGGPPGTSVECGEDSDPEDEEEPDEVEPDGPCGAEGQTCCTRTPSDSTCGIECVLGYGQDRYCDEGLSCLSAQLRISGNSPSYDPLNAPNELEWPARCMKCGDIGQRCCDPLYNSSVQPYEYLPQFCNAPFVSCDLYTHVDPVTGEVSYGDELYGGELCRRCDTELDPCCWTAELGFHCGGDLICAPYKDGDELPDSGLKCRARILTGCGGSSQRCCVDESGGVCGDDLGCEHDFEALGFTTTDGTCTQ